MEKVARDRASVARNIPRHVILALFAPSHIIFALSRGKSITIWRWRIRGMTRAERPRQALVAVATFLNLDIKRCGRVEAEISFTLEARSELALVFCEATARDHSNPTSAPPSNSCTVFLPQHHHRIDAAQCGSQTGWRSERA